MAIYLGHTTAERILDCPEAPHFESTDEVPMRDGFVDTEAMGDVDLTRYGITERDVLDVVVSDRGKRRDSKRIACHVSSRDLPHGAYLRLASNVYVASPELCLLQRAPQLSFAQRVMLASRFCGTYALSDENSQGFVARMSITTPERLYEFVHLCRNARGVLQALEAIACTLPNAASPMETAMAMPFYLPSERGGFALPKPTMNFGIELNELACAMAGTIQAYVDVYWEDGAVGLEYQSELFHRGDEKYGKDIGRQIALESMGKVIHMVTIEQMKNPAQLEWLAMLVADRLGLELDLREGAERREGLIQDILSTRTMHSISTKPR
ncbi:MAG: hypothetical protein Q4A07_12845 [Coriobacteriales bacterium]|nr:hypothetical protein [Coriobacteriales bacterium]